MKNVSEYRKRFYSLLESEVGSVKPLLTESGEDELVGHSIVGLKIPKTSGVSNVSVELDNGYTYSYKVLANNGVKAKIRLNNACIARDTPYTQNDLPQGCEVILHLVDFNGEEYKCTVGGRCDKYNSYAGGGTDGTNTGSPNSNTPKNSKDWKPNFYDGGSTSSNNDIPNDIPSDVRDQILKDIRGGVESQQYTDDFEL